jgi:hypothetical protein
MTTDITPEAVERFNRAWKPMNTAPRDGTWFVARTSFGYTRLVYFSDHFDRFPISDCGEVWSTAPVEWAALADVCHAIDALTASQAETAAAYKVAANKAMQRKGDWDRSPDHPYDKGYWAACDECAHEIRALTPADSKAALDRMIAEARTDGMREALDAAIDYTLRVYGDDWKFLSNPIDRERILAPFVKGTPHE